MTPPRKRIPSPKAASRAVPNASATPAIEADKSLVIAIRQIWEGARVQVVRSVNSALVQANWLIGRQIVEAQQAGKGRAGYGEQLLESLSSLLRAEYGSGFSLSALKYIRLFYPPTRTCSRLVTQCVANWPQRAQ